MKSIDRDEEKSFSLSPVKNIPEAKTVRRYKPVKKDAGRYLSNGEYWDIFHKMMREGSIIRYRISGVCDVETPTQLRKVVEPYKTEKIHFVDLI